MNANSRLMLSLALVEHGTHQADEYAEYTVDKALVSGHFYCDKAPLASYLAAAALLPWKLARVSIGQQQIPTAYHVANAVTGAIPFGIFGVLVLHRLLFERRPATAATVWLVSLTLFGTFAFAYAGIFMAHTLAGLLLVMCYVLAIERGRRLTLAGFLGGCSVLAEYPLIIMQAMIALGLILRADRRSGLWRYLMGAAPPAGYLLVYNFLITKSPWVFPYQLTMHFPTMHEHLGIGLPDWSALLRLCIDLRRGVLIYSPVLIILAPLVALNRDLQLWRRALVLSGFGAMMLFYSSIPYWDGGWCFGPRYLTATVMLLLYEGCAAAGRARRWLTPCLILGGIGLVPTLLAVATDPMIDPAAPLPVVHWIWPRLQAAFVNPTNIPHELGFANGRYLIVVWLLIWGLGTWFFAKARPLEVERAEPQSFAGAGSGERASARC